MEPLTFIIIAGGVIIGNELLISLLRTRYLSHHKVANRRRKHETKKDYTITPPDKKRS